MKESRSNWGHVCPEHAPRSGGYAARDPQTVVGLHVKLAFPAKDGRLEHMWVLVVGVHATRARLHGHLNNDPTLRFSDRSAEHASVNWTQPLQDGTAVEFCMKDVEDIT